MCTGRFSMIERMIAASVVDLPEPVGPVIRTRPAGMCDEGLQDLGQAELGDLGDLEGDPPEDGGDRAALDVEVGAEAGDARHAVADVDRLVLLELLPLGGRQDAEQHLFEVLGLERLGVDRDELSLDPQEGRAHRLQVEVRRLLLGHELEELGESQSCVNYNPVRR